VRIGVFGGAFDPPHAGHVAIADVAIKQLRLDRLIIVPTGQAWHKKRPLTAAQHRLAMAKLAFTHPVMQVDEQEVWREAPSYTFDTLTALRQLHPDASWYLIVGADQARAFTTWHRWQELLQLAIICVVSRDALHPDWNLPAAQQLPLQLPLMPLSSTQIRQAIASHHPINALVPAAVMRYIDEHHLYRSDE
jgi:nicotinate-nucleotide adenylyltransferase